MGVGFLVGWSWQVGILGGSAWASLETTLNLAKNHIPDAKISTSWLVIVASKLHPANDVL